MQRSEAAKLVAMLVAAYRDQSVSDATAEVYERMLLDLPFPAAQAAVSRVVATSKWFPTVAELRAAVVAVERGERRSGVEAWGDVVDAIRRVGSYRPPPRFADELVAECVTLMGWRALCLGSNEAADRARFAELYDALATRERADAQAGRALPAPVRGLLDASPRRGGPPTLAIGGRK